MKLISLGPEQALAVQGLMASAALRVAIKEVQTAVERVEGKVDDLVAMTKAHTIAGVVGKYRLLAEYVDRMDRTGALPDVDWDTVAGLGPELAQGIEELRRFALARVNTLAQTRGAKKRADQLHQMANESQLGDVLRLLALAEKSHYLWQCLRIERSRTSDPELVGEILDSAFRMLRDDQDADRELVLALKRALEEHGTLKPLEIHHILSWNKLETDVPRLRQEVEAFAYARGLQVGSWSDLDRPTLKEAQAEVRRLAIDVRDGVLERELPRKASEGVRELELPRKARELSDLTSERSRKALAAVRRRSRRSGDTDRLAPTEDNRQAES